MITAHLHHRGFNGSSGDTGGARTNRFPLYGRHCAGKLIIGVIDLRAVSKTDEHDSPDLGLRKAA